MEHERIKLTRHAKGWKKMIGWGLRGAGKR